MTPKVRVEPDNFSTSGPTHFTPKRQHSSLLESTGHRIKDGHRVGDDKFYVFLDVEEPGLGSALDAALYRGGFEGGPFSEDTFHFTWRSTVARAWNGWYNGDFTPYEQALPEPVVVPYTDKTLLLNELGTSRLRRYRPGNPLANLGQFLIELRDFPHLPGQLLNQLRTIRSLTLQQRKDISSEYLNLEFGWRPLLSDIRKMYRLQRVVEDRIKQLVRDNGLTIRRRPKVEGSTDYNLLCEGVYSNPFGDLGDDSLGGNSLLSGYRVIGPYGINDGGNNAFVGQCKYSLYEVENVEVGFFGTFRYYVPDIGSSQWTARAKLALFDANPTPSLLWEVLPWSWLVDWFSNVGDLISNLSTNAVDNEVVTNAGITYHKHVKRFLSVETEWDGTPGRPFLWRPDEFVAPGSDKMTWSHTEITKIRHPSGLFGFGSSFDGLSARQWAILAALTQSRQSRYKAQ